MFGGICVRECGDGLCKEGGNGVFPPQPGTVKPVKATRWIRKNDCAYCAEHGDESMMPPHDASANCESGKRPHCTCDICF